MSSTVYSGSPIHLRPILVVAPQWIGDAVMALSLIQALAQANSSCSIYVLATPWVAPIFAEHPDIAKTLVFQAVRTRLQWRERKEYAKTHIAPLLCGVAYILPNSWKSALIPWFAGIDMRIGYIGEVRWGLINHRRRLTVQESSFHQSWRYRALLDNESNSSFGLLSAIDNPKLHISSNAAASLISHKHHNYADNTRWIALCVGAEFGPAKMWPISHWCELIKKLLANGFGVLIIGTAKEQVFQEAVIKNINTAKQQSILPLCGKTTLAEALSLISYAHAVFSNDSGLMHVAAALEKPLIAFFGSSNEHATSPLTHDGVPTTALARDDVPCRPCMAKTCRFGHYDCLNLITPEDALKTFNSLQVDLSANNILKKTLRQQQLIRRKILMKIGAASINLALSEQLIDVFQGEHVFTAIQESAASITIGVYAPINNEPDLSIFYAWARKKGYSLALPAIKETADNVMEYRKWQQATFSNLPICHLGNSKVPQGVGDVVVPNIMLLPCVGFSKDGYRLGYGGGFFDRYLDAHLPKANANNINTPVLLTIAIGLDENLIEKCFNEPHDYSASLIITPSKTIFSLPTHLPTHPC